MMARWSQRSSETKGKHVQSNVLVLTVDSLCSFHVWVWLSRMQKIQNLLAQDYSILEIYMHCHSLQYLPASIIIYLFIHLFLVYCLSLEYKTKKLVIQNFPLLYYKVSVLLVLFLFLFLNIAHCFFTTFHTFCKLSAYLLKLQRILEE